MWSLGVDASFPEEQCPLPVETFTQTHQDDTLKFCDAVRELLECVDDGVARTEAERRPPKVRRLLTSIDLTTMVDDVSAVKETDDKPAVPTGKKSVVRSLTIAGLCLESSTTPLMSRRTRSWMC